MSSTDLLIVAGVIACAMAVLVPIGYVFYAVCSSFMEHRRAEARRVTVHSPTLGPLTSTDDRYWHGEWRDLQITIESAGSPPTHPQVVRITTIAADLTGLSERARQYIAQNKAHAECESGDAVLEPEAITLNADDTYELDMSHEQANGWFSVQFRGQSPFGASYSD